jgi:hypothetical protein
VLHSEETFQPIFITREEKCEIRETTDTAGLKMVQSNAELSKTVQRNRNFVATVNWNRVSVTCSSCTEVLLTLSRLHVIRPTSCNLTSNLMVQTSIICVNSSFPVMCVNKFLNDLRISEFAFSRGSLRLP